MKRLACAAAALLWSLPLAVGAEDPNAARNLAASCAMCHGTDGRRSSDFEALAGMPQAELVRKLTEFRDGKKPATVMHQIAKGYTDREIALIAAYFAGQRK